MRAPKPWHFFFLVLPYGVSFGFVSVALPYVARERGIGIGAIGAVVAAAFVPHSLKVLWAPVVDTTLGRKTWYLVALAILVAGTFASMAMPITPSTLGALTAVVVASQVGLTLLYMACEGVLGRALPPERKPTAAGWLMAGTFFGLGVGGGVAIELVTRLPGAVAGAVIALALMACALPLLAFDEPPRDAGDEAASDGRGIASTLRDLGRDLWGLLRSRRGAMAVVVALSTVGTGAAGNLLAALAPEWHASRTVVEITNGWLGGVAGAVGAAAGGWLSKRIDRRAAFALSGAITAAAGVTLVVAPRSPAPYVALGLLYIAATGMAYASFSAFAFETAGRQSVATKYNILASLMNASIFFKTRANSTGHARWGASGVLLTDATLTVVGILAVGAAAALTRPARR
jgi:PAT family beta-lactamase induction signal transducer AmpG